MTSGATLTTTIDELVQSGFISAYFPFGKKKTNKIFRLTDEYSLFYLKFMEQKYNDTQDVWKHLSQTQSYKSWSGYAFESICLKHLPQIKYALGISGIYSLTSTFYKRGDNSEEGAQIDLVIDRNDHVVNLFEIKFYSSPYPFSKGDNQQLRKKMSVFKSVTKTRKQVFWTLITTFGIQSTPYSFDLGTLKK